MKTKPQQLKELLDSIDYPHLFDIVDTMWYMNGDSVYWNEDDNLRELYLQDGNTYGGYLPEGVTEWEGYTVANFDNQCGQWITLFLNNEKKVEYRELENKYE